MGNLSDATEVEDREEYTEENGYFLSGNYVPQEVLVQILSFVDVKTLTFRCRRVCKNWKEIIQLLVLKYKAEEEGLINLNNAPKLLHHLEWIDYYWIINKKPFGKNLLKNNCGQDKFNNWEVLSSGGDGWTVENSPHGTENLPAVDSKGEASPDFNGLSSCFATSYHSCSKQQIIDLESEGLTPNIMDYFQPSIEISEWIACRFDCGCVYEMKLSLLDKDKKPLKTHDFRENFSHLPREIWQKVSHTFSRYGPGVRYVLFYHGGMDSQFWAGHYGSKMSGGIVKVLATMTDKPSLPSSSSSEDSVSD